MKPPAPCGTYAASQRHRRRGEPLDAACEQARRDYNNQPARRAVRIEAQRRQRVAARAHRAAHRAYQQVHPPTGSWQRLPGGIVPAAEILAAIATIGDVA